MRDRPAREPHPAMDRHDHQHTRPGSRLDAQLADRLALPGQASPAVWHVPPAQQPGCLSPQLADLLLNDQTQVGDVVLDIDDDVAFAATAVAAGRRHHTLGGAHHLAAMSPAAGYLDLILLHWPRPAVNPRWLLAECRSLLGAAGCLVIAVCVEGDQRVAHLTALGGAAAAAGLRPIRHVAALDPDSAPRSTPGVATHGTAMKSHRHSHTVTHPHTDLLILAVGDVEATHDE
ncbi:hypothetical protein [Virgisporangium aurantiacum]|uniref:Uncharacterized protein n=1 Tax=Virgisporangium aurantiacum TaxID=175570 RepID=A0A8J3ZL23_9ACTN|nr:hypothetical protein [Virgisporangium aurantiacum]GIJ63443.1 hypothetical protein Vau01_109590 [Virgisporangium aurantiacum]